jgi:hypothetical protein
MFERLRQEAIENSRGKSWLARLPVFLGLAYVLLRFLFNPDYASILAPLDLGIHELGHLLTSFLGQTVCVASGTLAQLAVPVFSVFNFYRQKDFFAIAASLGWLAVNLFEVARYCADARSLSLPLVSVFGQEGVVHDWEYLLGKAGLLPYDRAIAAGIRTLGDGFLLCSLAMALWVLWVMRDFSLTQSKTGV